MEQEINYDIMKFPIQNMWLLQNVIQTNLQRQAAVKRMKSH